MIKFLPVAISSCISSGILIAIMIDNLGTLVLISIAMTIIGSAITALLYQVANKDHAETTYTQTYHYIEDPEQKD